MKDVRYVGCPITHGNRHGVLALWLGLWEGNHCKTHSTVSNLQTLHVCTACPPEPIAFLVLPFALA